MIKSYEGVTLIRVESWWSKCLKAESVTHNYYNSSMKPKFHKNTRLVGKIIKKNSLTSFY